MAFNCTSCKDTGSRFVRFYSAADRLCTCARGEELRSWYVLTPAQQDERARVEAEARVAEAREARRAARAAR